METRAVVLEAPGQLALRSLALDAPGEGDVVVDVAWSGVSAGTERLLWSGRMPSFPGMGYPLVPGYESVGRIVGAGPASGRAPGEFVFVPGARCFGAVRGLFGGAAARLVLQGARALPIGEALGEFGVLLALAATAHHVLAGGPPPELIVGHGALGRLLARIVIALGHPVPTVWERDPARLHTDPARNDGARARPGGAVDYPVLHPDADPRRDYRAICDASGDAGLLDTLIARLAPGGEVVLAGFYADRPSFAFPPAFMREARLRVAAQWADGDLRAVRDLAEAGRLSLDGLITHRADAAEAPDAYRTAFADPGCLKMVLDWRTRP